MRPCDRQLHDLLSGRDIKIVSRNPFRLGHGVQFRDDNFTGRSLIFLLQTHQSHHPLFAQGPCVPTNTFLSSTRLCLLTLPYLIRYIHSQPWLRA